MIGPVADDGGADPAADAAPIPPFHFDDGGTGPAPDAGPTITPVDKDPGAAQGARIWATDTDGRLISFREKATDVVSVKLVTGLVMGATGEKLLNITYRPSNAKLYGLSSTSRLYVVDPAAGVASMVGDGAAFTPGLLAQANGFDVNPVDDRLRIQTDVDQDLRLDPTTGKVAAVDATLAFATGDANFGQSPNLVGTAYTNPTPIASMLYAIDSTRNLLTRLPNPDDGMVETIGPLGVDVDPTVGFDIGKTGTAYAALHVGNETGLYTVNLTTAAATKVGVIGYPLGLTSIAVEP